MTRRLPLLACLALLTAASAGAGSRLQDESSSDAPSASERLGIRPGSHEVQLFVGALQNDFALSQNKIVPPLDAEPYRMRIELDSGTSFGLGYFYQAHERWAVGGTISRSSTELAFETPFDRASEEALLLAAQVNDGNAIELSEEDKLSLLDRVERNSRSRDVDLTLIDVSAVYIINPEGPWIGEIGGGLGWSTLDSDEDPMVFEQIFRNECDPTDPNCIITVANEVADPTNGAGCPAGNDPCEVLSAEGGLTWHLLGGLRYAVSDSVHLRLGAKLRLMEAMTDPGDSFVSTEANVGVVFRFGGE